MILKGDIITKNDAQNAFFSSFEGKYTIMDNLDEKGEPIIHARKEVYNAEYVYVTVVLRGTLNMIIGGTRVEVKANEYIAVMPCMSVIVEESRCIFFAFLNRNHLMADIYKRTGVNSRLHYHAFKFRHARFSPDSIARRLFFVHICQHTSQNSSRLQKTAILSITRRATANTSSFAIFSVC